MKNIPPALRIGISVYIYIYIYEHEATQKPISENNIGAPMGCPKLELLANNGVHICHALLRGPSKS